LDISKSRHRLAHKIIKLSVCGQDSYRTFSGEEACANLTTVTTNEQSQYSDVWTPETAGTYDVKASWLGDESISSAESDVQSITVQDTPAPSVPLYIYMAAAGVAAIILAAMAFYFLRVKKPKPT
jgi:hypothetical protein